VRRVDESEKHFREGFSRQAVREGIRTHESADEPLSPKLALVDPALVARARAALGETPAEEDRPRLQPTGNADGHFGGVARAIAGDGSNPSATAFLSTVVALLTAPIFAGAGFAAAMWVQDGTVSAGATQPPAVRGGSMPRGSISVPRPRTKPPMQTASNSQARRLRRKRQSARRTPSRARTFAWPQVQGANAQIAAPRPCLAGPLDPCRFAFARGRYWWRVPPAVTDGSGTRYAEPVAAWLIIAV
jgi:hypothetical protein